MLLGYTQGHPMDLFLKISVLQANFCWQLGHVEEIICPWKESVFRIVTMCYGSETPPPPSLLRGEFCPMTTPKLATPIHCAGVVLHPRQGGGGGGYSGFQLIGIEKNNSLFKHGKIHQEYKKS